MRHKSKLKKKEIKENLIKEKTKLKGQNGITLIALVITIIVLLILAAVSIATLTGENGILTRANDARTETEIADEKEKVELSATGALAEDLGGEIDIDKLRTELGKYFQDGKYDVQEGVNEDGTEGYIVTITENDPNGRKYFVDKNGNVTEYTLKEGEATEGTGINFNMSVGAIEVEFLKGTSYSIGEANEPLLDENTMIPIKYNEATSKWRATTKDDLEWYSYDIEDKKWANVMLSDGTYTVDTVPTDRDLEESELGSMFVWIPRYAYKIVYFDSQPEKESYIASDRKDTSKIVGYSDARGMVDKEGKVRADVTENIIGIKVGDNYRPHPVFESNVEQGGWGQRTTGIWVGKFETTTKPSSNGTNMILPNQKSQRDINVSTMFSRAQDIGRNLNMTLDSHMMKNTEWGATAYLAESKYGRNGTELAINNSSSFITGTSGGNANASETDATYVYNTANGVLASTTENVYGIYDMSGGSWEYVMGVYGTDTPTTGYSGFTQETFPDRKYYNMYEETTENNTNIGDALYETSNWNKDGANFVNNNTAFFRRGARYYDGFGTGIFAYSVDHGGAYHTFSFRICIV